jgi:hypothetical protein
MASKLELILEELNRTAMLPIANLHPDRNNSCLIRLPTGVEFQLESDAEERNLIVGSDLGDIPPGRYRQDLFKQALKSNGAPYPHYGTFAYSNSREHLILFDSLSYEGLTGQQVAEYLEKFIQKALTWRTAMNSNDIPAESSEERSSGGFFGLKP